VRHKHWAQVFYSVISFDPADYMAVLKKRKQKANGGINVRRD
jgi:hypothetical protein